MSQTLLGFRRPSAKHAPIGSSNFFRAVTCPPSLDGADMHSESEGAKRGTRLHHAAATKDFTGLNDYERLGVERCISFREELISRFLAHGQTLASEDQEVRVELKDEGGAYLSHGTADLVLLFERGAVLCEWKFHPQGSVPLEPLEYQLMFQAACVLQASPELKSVWAFCFAPYTGWEYSRKFKRDVVELVQEMVFGAEQAYITKAGKHQPSLDACRYCPLLGTCAPAASIRDFLSFPRQYIPGIEQTEHGPRIADERELVKHFEETKLSSAVYEAQKEMLKAAVSQSETSVLKLRRGRESQRIPDQERIRDVLPENVLTWILMRKQIAPEDIIRAFEETEQMSRSDAEEAAMQVIGDNLTISRSAPSLYTEKAS